MSLEVDRKMVRMVKESVNEIDITRIHNNGPSMANKIEMIQDTTLSTEDGQAVQILGKGHTLVGKTNVGHRNTGGLGSIIKEGAEPRAFKMFSVRPIPKARSLNFIEVDKKDMGIEDIAELAMRLKTEDPPMSLEEVREHRAAIKQDRKIWIDLIRDRTTTRPSPLGISFSEDGARVDDNTAPFKNTTESKVDFTFLNDTTQTRCDL